MTPIDKLAAGRYNAALVACLLACGYLLASTNDYDEAVARETATREHRNWVQRNCIPTTPNSRGTIEVRHDGTTQCTRYENAGYGRAPQLVFAEVRE
jgi:hypothetical protein